MAYGLRYQAEWRFKDLGGYLYIDKKDYVGSVDDLILQDKAIGISRVLKDWESHILNLQCEFMIHNNFADYFDLLELMTGTEKLFRVRVETTIPTSVSIFEGFLNTETTEQRYLNRQVLRLVASSYLSKLKNVYPDSIDTLQNESMIDIINEALVQTGSDFDIRVNSTLYASGDTLGVGQTLFNKNALFTETFWKNNIDRKNSFEIIESILTTFNAYLYWWDGRWYIERYHDIWQTSIDFVEYTSGVSYGQSDSGSVENESRAIQDISTIQWIETTQTLFVDPGFLLIQIRLNRNNSLLLNMTIGDLADIQEVFGVVPFPDLRTWEEWADPGDDLIWLGAGQSYLTIKNSIARGISDPGSYTDFHRGIYTRFNMTVDNDEAYLTIKFKYAFSLLDFSGFDFNGDWDKYSFKFNWYLRDTPGNNFVMFNESSEEWEFVNTVEANGLQTTTVSGTNFDPDNKSCEVSITIPLGTISGYSGDKSLVFMIGIEDITWNPGPVTIINTTGPASVAYIGDIIFTVSGEQLADNIIEGTQNTDFLGKKTIVLDLSDVANLNYKNGVIQGTNWDQQTTTWTMDGIDFFSLIQWILIDKFRLYNVSKQRLSGNVESGTTLYRPFQLFTESKQSDKKFVITGIHLLPARNQTVLTLREYDNETVINLI